MYRRGTVDDAARLASFAARTFSETYAAHNTAEDMRAYQEEAFGVVQQTRELADPSMMTVLAIAGERLLAYAQVRCKAAPACVPQDAPAEIYRFYVDATAHGTGVAQQLMREALLAARDLGGKDVWLGVWEQNARAIAFYSKMGFRDVGTQVFQLGSDRQTDRILVVNLPPIR